MTIDQIIAKLTTVANPNGDWFWIMRADDAKALLAEITSQREALKAAGEALQASKDERDEELGTAWECECGRTEYNDMDECQECGREAPLSYRILYQMECASGLMRSKQFSQCRFYRDKSGKVFRMSWSGDVLIPHGVTKAERRWAKDHMLFIQHQNAYAMKENA